ncbi:MAG: hypothetical protein HQK67_04335 [Desulfamplus sp.]|nr:hypothetical protein [Desulfamplus sp.]
MSFPTWSDLNDESLIPPLGERYSPDLGSVALMVSTEPDFRYIEANSGKKKSLPFFLGNLFIIDDKDALGAGKDALGAGKDALCAGKDALCAGKDVFDIGKYALGSGKDVLGDSTVTLNCGNVSVAGPYLGSPCAAMILESLVARGVSKVVIVGWCGSISDELQTGDILIPDSAICDEGTSRNYMEMPLNTDFPTVFSCP